jgi:hypothetical protein
MLSRVSHGYAGERSCVFKSQSIEDDRRLMHHCNFQVCLSEARRGCEGDIDTTCTTTTLCYSLSVSQILLVRFLVVLVAAR